MNKYDYLNKESNVKTMCDYMLNRTLAMFDYQNLPTELNRDIIEKQLQKHGKGVLFKHNEQFYFLDYSVTKKNAYDEPIEITVSNNYLGLSCQKYKVNEECVLFKSDSLELGLMPLFERANTMQVENDISIMIAMYSKRAQLLLSANDDNTYNSAKEFINKIKKGELAVIAESKMFESLRVNNQIQHDTNIHDLIELQQYIKGSLYNELALKQNYNMKKGNITAIEILNDDNANYPLVDNMLYEREQAIERVKKVFNLNVIVEFSSSWDYRINNGLEVTKKVYDELGKQEKENKLEPKDEPKDEPKENEKGE